MIDLTTAPFNLTADDIKWVEQTISDMSIEEKIGQLFVPIGYSGDPDYLDNVMLSHHIGGIMYRCGNGAEMQNTHRYLRLTAKFRCLSARISKTAASVSPQTAQLTESRCSLLPRGAKSMLTGSEKSAVRRALRSAATGRSLPCATLI